MNLIIGNILSLIGCTIMVASGYIKSKQKTLIWQTVHIVFNTAACFTLGAYSGAIVNALSIPRNILAYKDKLKLPLKLVILALSLSLSIIFNKNGWIGYLPLISTVAYILLMDKVSDIPFKILIVATCVLWGLHDFLVQDYVAAAFDAGCTITSSIAIFRLCREKKYHTPAE